MRQKLVLIFMSCLFTSMSWAEELSGELTLVQALDLAYQKNPLMEEARHFLRGAKGEKITAGSFLDPEVELEIGKGDLDAVTVKQPFEPLGVRHLKSKIAGNNVLALEQSVKSVWSGVYLDVRETYARVILNKKELELQRNNLKSMRQFFGNVQIKYQGGQVFKNQLQRARMELFKAESAYLKAENDLSIDKARLNLLLGRARDVAFDIQEDLKEEKLELDLNALVQMAAQSPDVKKESIELDSKIKNVRKEELSRLPSYSFGVQKTDKEDENNYAAILGVRIPLWNLNQGEVKKAMAERDGQQVKLDAFKNEVDFEVYRLYQEAELGTKQLGLYRRSLEDANEMFRLAGLRYREGDANFMEYLDQVQASMDSRMQYYRGLYALSQSISALEKAVYSSLRGEEFLK